MPKENKGKAAVRGAEDAQSHRKRTAPYASGAGPSSKSKPQQQQQHAHKRTRHDKPQPSSSLPGASKLKSSIRQTKRLLAKPNLAPGTKIEAERRLKALEADLELQSRKQLEKSRASRYHRVKFVERQKLVRRIARCKRNLAQLESGATLHGSDSDSDAGSDAEDQARAKKQASNMSKPDLVSSLASLRELLHYVVQYPADLRYVALFSSADEGPVPPHATEDDNTRQKAYRHLETVRKAIGSGELSKEPEVELASKDGHRSKLARPAAESASKAFTDKANEQSKKSKSKQSAKQNSSSKHLAAVDQHGEASEDDADGVKGDDFFANSSDEED